ncbi:hypothetical protein A2U01_0057564, partial [Trifolium medium]|nr:hypothetical protein [Trifolium medium]
CLLSPIGVLKDHRRRNSSLLTGAAGVKQIGRPKTQINHLEEIQYQQHVPCKAAANQRNDGRGDLNAPEDRIQEEKAVKSTIISERYCNYYNITHFLCYPFMYYAFYCLM